MSRKDFSMKFNFPTSWQHGRGFAGKTGEILKDLGCKNTLLITDKILVDLGVLKPVFESLEAAGIGHTLCDAVTIEPTVNLFDTIVGQLDLNSFDSVVAVGGGSVIDVAKGLAVIAKFGGHIRDYGGLDKVTERPDWKIIAIPTTSGTGSEISNGAVFIDEEIQSKFPVISLNVCPTVALTDPLMTRSMPPKVTANSGIDALVHAIESYVSKNASVASEPFAIRAIELIGEGLKTAYASGDDLDAREAMQLGSTMAMASTLNALLGLCHAMAMPLCALYHMPHGQACGMVLPYVMAYNAAYEKEKIANIFKVMGFLDKKASADDVNNACYEKLEGLLSDIGVAAKLEDMGYQDDHMETIVTGTLNSVQTQFNPGNPTADDIEKIVKRIIF